MLKFTEKDKRDVRYGIMTAAGQRWSRTAIRVIVLAWTAVAAAAVLLVVGAVRLWTGGVGAYVTSHGIVIAAGIATLIIAVRAFTSTGTGRRGGAGRYRRY